MFADARAGMNSFSAGAVKFEEAANEAANDYMGGSIRKENAAAVNRKNGPPARFSNEDEPKKIELPVAFEDKENINGQRKESDVAKSRGTMPALESNNAGRTILGRGINTKSNSGNVSNVPRYRETTGRQQDRITSILANAIDTDIGRMLEKGEMVNEFKDKINWHHYYQKILSAKYNADLFDDGDITTMYLDGATLTLKMLSNGEWSVIGKEVSNGKRFEIIQKSNSDDEETWISGERSNDSSGSSGEKYGVRAGDIRESITGTEREGSSESNAAVLYGNTKLILPSANDNNNIPVTQKISSAKTSIKQVPALFKNKNVVFGAVNIDIGGGRFDLATDYLKSIGTDNKVFDPYNRSKETNSDTLKYLKDGNRADTATCANVLNVIAEPAARANVILEAAKAIEMDGTAYFMVYEGDGAE